MSAVPPTASLVCAHLLPPISRRAPAVEENKENALVTTENALVSDGVVRGAATGITFFGGDGAGALPMPRKSTAAAPPVGPVARPI